MEPVTDADAKLGGTGPLHPEPVATGPSCLVPTATREPTHSEHMQDPFGLENFLAAQTRHYCAMLRADFEMFAQERSRVSHSQASHSQTLAVSLHPEVNTPVRARLDVQGQNVTTEGLGCVGQPPVPQPTMREVPYTNGTTLQGQHFSSLRRSVDL